VATLKKLSKFQTVITQIKNNNYEIALELLSKIDTNLDEKNLENKLYGSIYFLNFFCFMRFCPVARSILYNIFKQ